MASTTAATMSAAGQRNDNAAMAAVRSRESEQGEHSARSEHADAQTRASGFTPQLCLRQADLIAHQFRRLLTEPGEQLGCGKTLGHLLRLIHDLLPHRVEPGVITSE